MLCFGVFELVVVEVFFGDLCLVVVEVFWKFGVGYVISIDFQQFEGVMCCWSKEVKV